MGIINHIINKICPNNTEKDEENKKIDYNEIESYKFENDERKYYYKSGPNEIDRKKIINEKITLCVLRKTFRKSLDISLNATIRELVEKTLQLFNLPINDISPETYFILIGSKHLNKKENLNKTIYDKGIEEDEMITIYLTSEII